MGKRVILIVILTGMLALVAEGVAISLNDKADTAKSNNQAWAVLAGQKSDDDVEVNKMVGAMKEILLKDIDQERKFADLMTIADCYYSDRDYFRFYWLALSQTKTGDEQVDKATEATRRLLLTDVSVGDKMADLSAIIEYGYVDSDNIGVAGHKFQFYARNQDKVAALLQNQTTVDELTEPLGPDYKWVWIFLPILIAAMIVEAIVFVILEARKSKKTKNK